MLFLLIIFSCCGRPVWGWSTCASTYSLESSRSLGTRLSIPFGSDLYFFFPGFGGGVSSPKLWFCMIGDFPFSFFLFLIFSSYSLPLFIDTCLTCLYVTEIHILRLTMHIILQSYPVNEVIITLLVSRLPRVSEDLIHKYIFIDFHGWQHTDPP